MRHALEACEFLNGKTYLAYLTNAWHEARSFDFTGGLAFRPSEYANWTERGEDLNSFLFKAVTANPDLFKNFSNAEIVDVLVALNKVEPCTNVLTALYAAYKPDANHALKAWELGKRAAFLTALDSDPEISAITSRWLSPDICPGPEDKKYLAAYQHDLQTKIYGALPAVTRPYEIAKPPTGEYGSQNIWSASFWRDGNTLFYNTYEPQDPRELKCTFWDNAADFQSTIAHDTDHIVQHNIAERVMKFRAEEMAHGHLGNDLPAYMRNWADENLPGGLDNDINRMILTCDEMRNFGLLMHYSVHNNYYLSQRYANGNERPGVTFEIYKTNPSENHTYDLQEDVDRFLALDADSRTAFLEDLASQREYHLSLVNAPSAIAVEKQSQPALSLAA